jgi:hypothetical protein
VADEITAEVHTTPKYDVLKPEPRRRINYPDMGIV